MCGKEEGETREREGETREREGTRKNDDGGGKGKDGDVYRQTKREERRIGGGDGILLHIDRSFILIGKEDQPVNPDITLYSSSVF